MDDDPILPCGAGEGDHPQDGGGGGTALHDFHEGRGLSLKSSVKAAPSIAARSPSPAGGGGVLWIEGYASLWGAADLNGDVVAKGAFADSLARTGTSGVRMLHQHESRAVVGVWDQMVEDERGLWVRGRIHDWSAEARYAQALTRAGALDGLSIGFRAAKARRDGRLRVLSAVELWEVSLVTFPMLPRARFRCQLLSR